MILIKADGLRKRNGIPKDDLNLKIICTEQGFVMQARKNYKNFELKLPDYPFNFSNF